MSFELCSPVTSDEQVAALMRSGVAAVRAGYRARARRLFSAVLDRNPTHQEARLELAAVLDDPEEVAAHLGYALTLNRGSRRARRAVQELEQRTGARVSQHVPEPPPLAQARAPVPQPLVPATLPRRRRLLSRGRLVIGLVLLLVVLLLSFRWELLQTVLAALRPSAAPVSEATSVPSITASLTPMPGFSTPTPEQVREATPDPTQITSPEATRGLGAFTPTATLTRPPISLTVTATSPTPTGTLISEAPPTTTQDLTDVPDVETTLTPTQTATPEASVAPTKVPPDRSTSGKWIEVDLSQQKLYAHEGQETVFVARVSTGTRYYPTVTGRFKIYVKYRSAPMSGPGYYLPGVPWTMYFYRGYAIHGAYWHNNFGHPMSHGCVNMKVNEAKWLFNWAPKGTLVVVHR